MNTTKIILTALIVFFLVFVNVYSATEQIFYDDFETYKGWIRNPFGTDCATTGLWERDDPEETVYCGVIQMGSTISGVKCMVTAHLAGSTAGDYDIDAGKTSVRSPDIVLPETGELTLSFYYNFAYYSNSSSADYLRVKVVGSTTVTVFEALGSATVKNGEWKSASASLSSLAGQTIYILVEAADNDGASLVEAAIEDVKIETIVPPSPQSEWNYSVPGQITTDAHVGVGGNLSVGNTLFVKEIRGIGHVDPFKINEPLGTIDVLHIGASEVLASDFQASSAKINGPLYARDITVTLEEFPDWVFTKKHSLKPLSEIERYINENGRLPGFPSESEVKKNGVSIGEMQVKLLEQIEEMTLRMIQMQKRIDELEVQQYEKK